MSRWGHWSLSDLQPWSRSQGRGGGASKGGQAATVSRGRAGTPEKRKLRLGFLSKTCPVNGGCAGGPGEELAQPHRRSPALSLKDPSWSPNPEPSSYKALPLLSPAKPPSVAMTTGAGKAGAPRALPHHPLPSCSLQLGPGLRASRWLQPSPASETPAPSYWAWPQPPPAQKARRRAPTPAPPTPTPAPCPAMVPALPRAGPVSH